MKAIITNESKDNNPSPIEEIIKSIDTSESIMSIGMGNKISTYTMLNTEWDTIKQALTNYANMVEMLEGLREKYDGIHKSFGYPRYATVNPSEIVADITKVLEGK